MGNLLGNNNQPQNAGTKQIKKVLIVGASFAGINTVKKLMKELYKEKP